MKHAEKSRQRRHTKANAKVATIVIANGLRCYSRGFMSSVAFAGKHPRTPTATFELLLFVCWPVYGDDSNINLYLNVCCCIRTFTTTSIATVQPFLDVNEMFCVFTRFFRVALNIFDKPMVTKTTTTKQKYQQNFNKMIVLLRPEPHLPLL